MSIGQRIREAREQKNMTLDDVAKHCSTTRQTIYKYENGIVTNIPYDRIEALATALSVSPSYLFGWDKENTPDERQLTEGEWAMIKIFRLIPEDQQKAFLEMGRAYANNLKKE